MAARKQHRPRKRERRLHFDRGIGREALILLIITVIAWGTTLAYFCHGRIYHHRVRIPLIVVAAEFLLLPVTAYFITRWWRTRRRQFK